jgi:hypothetical protein
VHLPIPVRPFFDADRGDDVDALLSAFAPEATVEDEGRSNRGHAAIAAWWRAAKSAYGHTAEPFAVTGGNEAVEVHATVTGRFPGSPADLTFAFRVCDGAITHLRIG